MKLTDPLIAVIRLHPVGLAFHDDIGIYLLMRGPFREYDYICPWLCRSYAESQFNRDVSLGKAILTDKRLGDFLPNILFSRVSALGKTVNKVENPALGYDDGADARGNGFCVALGVQGVPIGW